MDCEKAESASDALDELVERTAGPQPGRRFFHAGMGVAIWAVLHYSEITSRTATVILGAVSVAALSVDLARLRSPRLNRWFFGGLSYLASPRERTRIASSTWFLVGVTGALALFPRAYAEAGILVLALADPAASWFGRRYGRRRVGTGTILGSTIFFGVTLSILVPQVGIPSAVGAAAIVTLVEATPLQVDDNLAVPIVTAAALWVLAGIPG